MESLAKTIERLMPKLRAIASRMGHWCIDDLVSEMTLAILVAGEGQTDGFYVRRAKDRARDYLRRERRHDQGTPSHENERSGAFIGVGEVAQIYDQDEDFIAANLGWE